MRKNCCAKWNANKLIIFKQTHSFWESIYPVYSICSWRSSMKCQIREKLDISISLLVVTMNETFFFILPLQKRSNIKIHKICYIFETKSRRKFSWPYCKSTAIFSFDHSDHAIPLFPAPSNIQDLFQDISNVHSFNTRSSTSNNYLYLLGYPFR